MDHCSYCCPKRPVEEAAKILDDTVAPESNAIAPEVRERLGYAARIRALRKP